MGLLTDGIQGSDQSRNLIFVRSGGGFRVRAGRRGCITNPSSDGVQLFRGGPSCKLHGVDENGFFGSQRLVLPDEVDQVLRGINELGTLWSELVVELGSLGIGKHASVDTDSGILGAINKPFDPVLWAVYMTSLDAKPVVGIDLICCLYPVPRVGEEIGGGF